MKTIEKKVYEFKELSQEIQNKVYNKWLNNDFQYFWHTENINSLECFLNFFGIGIKDYSIGGFNAYIKTDINYLDEPILELNGNRLLSYLENNFYKKIRKGMYLRKDYFKKGIQSVGNGKTKHSKCQVEYDITGYCFDFNFYQRDYKAIYKMNFKEFIEDKIEQFIIEYNNDVDACSSFKYFKEEQENQNNFFDEGGNYEIYN